MKRVLLLSAAFLMGCSIKAEMSVMKQWDRPAERTIVEDTSHNVKQPPRTTIETQEQIQVAPVPEAPKDKTPPAVPGMKPMNFEVPSVIIPEAQRIQTIYIHQHGDDTHACYVRRVVGTYAMEVAR